MERPVHRVRVVLVHSQFPRDLDEAAIFFGVVASMGSRFSCHSTAPVGGLILSHWSAMEAQAADAAAAAGPTQISGSPSVSKHHSRTARALSTSAGCVGSRPGRLRFLQGVFDSIRHASKPMVGLRRHRSVSPSHRRTSSRATENSRRPRRSLRSPATFRSDSRRPQRLPSRGGSTFCRAVGLFRHPTQTG